MLCEWLKESQLRSAWLSLDSEDLHVFGRYLATAIDALFPGALSSTFDVLAEPDITPDRLARALAAEIDDLPAPFALVLDDYHTIRDPRVHDTVEALSRHLPLNLRLVISGRSEPPFALARGLSVGLVDELQPESLRFTLDEAASFLSKTSGTVVSPEAARPILDRSQGWPTGLRFAALGARARRSIEGIGALRWDQDRLVREYFLDEVLLRQPPQVRWFLLSTSIVERFSAPLCAEYLRRDVPDDTRGGHDRVRDHTRSALISPFEGAIRAAQRTIDRLVEGNLFLTPLDERHTWYRYHPLFKQALLARLESTTTPGFVAQLRLRASLWHEANGFVEEAVHLAVLSGDVATACQIAERNTQSALDRQDVFEVERWLRWLPEDSVRLTRA